MIDHAVIYLEPGDGEPEIGRQWCQDDVWNCVDYDGALPTKYVRADIVLHLLDQLAPWLATADAGLPAVIKTIGECSDLHAAYRVARSAAGATQ